MSVKIFKTIGIISKQGDPKVVEALETLCTYLLGQGMDILLDESTAKLLPDCKIKSGSRQDIGNHCDLAIIVGGDGTLLNAARTLSDFDIPLVGVNLGRLGFLVDISSSKMTDYLDEILQGLYFMEERFLLDCRINRDGEEIGQCDAFNDIVVHKWNVARMIELETRINGRHVNLQRSDGLIVSTPTGSTAYALSAGGPIIYPTLNAIVLVPVCPHTMSNRPIVVDGDNQIEVIIGENNPDYTRVTCDGQITFELNTGDCITINKKKRTVNLIHPENHDHFEILRAKLHWAEHPS